MRILEVCDNALFEVGYLAASPERRMVSATMAVQRVLVDRLPGGLQAVFVTSDLQGRTYAADGSARLLGLALARRTKRAWICHQFTQRRVNRSFFD